MTIDVAEEATTASAGNNRACSDGGCGKNNCGSSERIRARDGTECGGSSEKNPFAMEVDQRRNCYTYRGFGHIARYCRNRGRGRPMDGGRIEEILNFADNLKEGENLELLN